MFQQNTNNGASKIVNLLNEANGSKLVSGKGILSQVKLKNCAPFTKCITKIDEAALDDAEDLDLDLIKYSSD